MSNSLNVVPGWPRPHIWLRYFFAIFIVALAIAVRLIFSRILGTSFLFITFYPAVIITALYGGLPAGLLATVLSALAADYFWMPPLLSFRVAGTDNILGLTVFVINCAAISAITEVMHRARDRAGKAEVEAKLDVERKKAESVTLARSRILLAASSYDVSVDDVLRISLDEIEEETGSEIGFYHFLEEDQETLSLQNWSTNTLNKMCTAEGKGRHYPVSKAGVWVDCVRERRPLIHNDYSSLPHRKGMPQGHAPVIRELVVPVMRSDRIVAIIGVGNKKSPYDSSDIGIVSSLGDFSWEIIERKRTDDALRESEDRFRAAFGYGAIPMALTGLDARIQKANQAFHRMLGYTGSELAGRTFIELTHPDDLPDNLAGIRRLVKGEVSSFRMEKRYFRKDGSILWGDMSTACVRDRQGNALYVVTHVQDITERKRADEALNEINVELKTALDEKEVLIKELYHRTKNNMNVISNFMHLQMNQINDPGLKQLFKEAQNRIQAMALVHEMLYKTKDLSKLDLKDYLDQLARSILTSYKARDIGLKLEVDSVPVSLYTAVPFGLILNELLSNSLKHAFPGSNSGEITVQLKTMGDKIEFLYSDNGVGLPEEFRIEGSTSLGLRLVDGLVKKQLLGSLEIVNLNGQGTRLIMGFDRTRFYAP